MFSEKSVLSKVILPIFMILFLIGLAGCGNKAGSNGSASGGANSPAPTNSQNAKTDGSAAAETPAATVPTKPGVVTYENYLNIKLDTTYEDVKNILGEGTKTTVSADIVNYRWNDQGKTITIRTNKGKVESKTQNKLGKTTAKLTADQFNKITNGMTIDQVAAILGPDYRETSYKKSGEAIIRSVVWTMPDSTYIRVMLKNDKVTNKYSTFDATSQ